MVLRKVIWTVRSLSDQNMSLGRDPAREVLEVRGGRRHLKVSTNEMLGTKGVSGAGIGRDETDILCPSACIDDNRLWLTNLPKRRKLERERHGVGGHRLEENGTTPSDE
ncbi:hypothetical protein [Halorubrum sp. SD690R]|uniref:hypothetical protein n=1 Tax=Halorubrum sp. SD690R TaxID=2518117 RepID=UPI00130535E5|nr:hypothetical protein [Halorubrum sp. SD690R]